MNLIKLFKRQQPQLTRKDARKWINEADVIRLNIGCGGVQFDDWLNIDRDILDIRNKNEWDAFLGDRFVTHVLAEHVFEHLDFDDALVAFCNVQQFLVPGGSFRFAVPDGNHPSAYVRELTGVNGTDVGADDHKYFYTINDISNIEETCGLKANCLEYFDNDGIFHRKEYDEAKGYIFRSSNRYTGRFTTSTAEYDRMINSVPAELQSQFSNGQFSYTSLLIDWVKSEPD